MSRVQHQRVPGRGRRQSVPEPPFVRGRFAGRTAIVTGAGSGIGHATALRLAREGARVVAADIAADRLKQLAAEFPDLVPVAGDIATEQGAQAVVAAAGGRVDALANVAGITDAFLPPAEVDDAGVLGPIARFRFPPEVITVAVRWYLRYALSYRDREELLAERGVEVDHVTVYRWMQRFTPLFADVVRPLRRATGDRWTRPTSRSPAAGGRPPADRAPRPPARRCWSPAVRGGGSGGLRRHRVRGHLPRRTPSAPACCWSDSTATR